MTMTVDAVEWDMTRINLHSPLLSIHHSTSGLSWQERFPVPREYFLSTAERAMLMLELSLRIQQLS